MAAEAGYIYVQAAEVEPVVVSPEFLEEGGGLYGVPHMAAEIFKDSALAGGEFYCGMFFLL